MLTIATFNVKDLFDGTDEKSRAHLDVQLSRLAEQLDELDADVVGLQEIGSETALKALVARMKKGGGYLEPVVGTPDSRGIRCALLSRFPILWSKILTAEALQFPRLYENDPAPFGNRIPLRRGIVQVRLDAGEAGPITFFVAHFKSRRVVPLRREDGSSIPPRTEKDIAEAKLRSLTWRAVEALFLRGACDEQFAAEETPAGHVVVMGDLNDVPGSTAVDIVRGQGGSLHHLSDCTESIDANDRFSIIHEGERQQIDHILASLGLHAHLTEAKFLNGRVRDHGPLPADGGAGVKPSVDSDHAPLVVTFG